LHIDAVGYVQGLGRSTGCTPFFLLISKYTAASFNLGAESGGGTGTV
jgi:hypothetical protein